MSPLAGVTVAADMRPPVKRYARAAAGADDHREHRVRPRRRAVHRFRHRQTVGVVSQPNFAVKAQAEVLVKGLAVEPGRVGVFHYPGIGRNRARDPHPHGATLSGRLLGHRHQGSDSLDGLPVILPRRG